MDFMGDFSGVIGLTAVILEVDFRRVGGLWDEDGVFGRRDFVLGGCYYFLGDFLGFCFVAFVD